jgi:hypothetical protein
VSGVDLGMLMELSAAYPASVTPAPATPVSWTAPTPVAPAYVAGVYQTTVTETADLHRVIALPRRSQLELVDPDGEDTPLARALVERINGQLRRPDWKTRRCRCQQILPNHPCILSVNGAQAWALHEAPLAGGLVALIATGGGKSLVDLLMTLAMGVKLAVCLAPAGLVKQLVREYELVREHFWVPNIFYKSRGKVAGMQGDVGAGVGRCPSLHLVSYEDLSQPSSTELLAKFGTGLGLVIADEMDWLANFTATRTMRFIRAFAAATDAAKAAGLGGIRFTGWTGTPVDKSVLEFAHLAAFALREGSPLPMDPDVALTWAQVLDPSPYPAPEGALGKLRTSPYQTIHEAFHRRLVDTPGVVATKASALAIPLHLLERRAPPIPLEVMEMIDSARRFKRPDGDELADLLEVAKVICECALGFYYRWVFPTLPRDPDGKLTAESKALISEWYARRAAWKAEVRSVLIENRPHLDSEDLLRRAARRYFQPRFGEPRYEGDLPTWASGTYLDWIAIEDSVPHETEAVWVSDYLVDDAAEWAASHRGVVWYRHSTFGERLAARAKLPHYGGGSEKAILQERGETSIVASLRSHGRGRDGLQYLYNHQLCVVTPSSGRMCEQFLARLHRMGQPKSEVVSWHYRHVYEMSEMLDKAMSRSEWARGMWGSSQKILNAVCEWKRAA